MKAWPVVVGIALVLAPSARLRADEPPAKSARDEASALFSEGEQAFARGDYRYAAERFERAYRTAPHPGALWNAARARQEAGELARAANLFERFLAEAPPGSRDRDQATQFLKEASAKLGRFELRGSSLAALSVDGEPVAEGPLWVNPGSHEIAGKHGSQDVRRTESVRAGETVEVSLAPPAAPPRAAEAPESRQTKPLGPGIFWTGVGLTALAGAATVWSGLDTHAARNDFDEAPTEEKLDAGQAKQTRTNVLLAVSLGLGALTGLGGVFLVEWGPEHERVALRAQF